MTLPPAKELASKAPAEVVDLLIDVAREAQAAVRLGDSLGPIVAYERIHEASKLARGSARDLLDVAAAFLEGLLRLDHGKRDLALRRFFQEHPEEANRLFGEILRNEFITQADLVKLLPEAETALLPLLNAEVVSRIAGRYQLGPQMRHSVMDLVEPLILRHWRMVQQVRAQIAFTRPPLKINDAAAFAASRLGISQDEARSHLTRDRIPEGVVAGRAIERRIGKETSSVAKKPAKQPLGRDQRMEPAGGARVPKNELSTSPLPVERNEASAA